jgi:hypothetical protein
MNKKMLKAIPVKSFDLASIGIPNLKNVYFINAYVRSKLLVMDIYDTTSDLKYRIFQTKTDFITLEGDTWRQSKLDNLFNWWSRPIFEDVDDSREIIRKYLNTDKDSIDAIRMSQEAIRKTQLNNRHKPELELIDAYMKPVRDVPKDFKKWINDVVLLESRYIIYEYKKTPIMLGYCTHCQNDVLVYKPKHNLPGICPSCKSTIIFKASGKFNLVIDQGMAQLVQKYPEGVIIREFDVSKKYIKKDSTVTYSEKNRTIITDGVTHFAWDEYKQTGKLKWCIDKRYWNYDRGPIYTNNLKRELKGTRYEYSGLTQMIASGHDISAMRYLEAYRTGPALEYLSKFKLFNLVSVLISPNPAKTDIDLKGKNPLEVLKLNKRNLNRAIAIDANYYELELIQTCQRESVYLPDDLIQRIALDQKYNIKEFVEISKLSTIHQLCRYLEKSQVRFTDYRDYIDMATKLNWNIRDQFIQFPRYFKQAHDQAQSLVKVKTAYADNIIIKKLYKNLNKQLSFKTEEYSIRLPKNAKEIIREGHTLHHCVSNYIQSVSKGNTLILLIREKDNPFNPYFTLELDPKEKRIRQVRGYDNCDPNEAIKALIDGYKKNLNKIKINIAC